MKGLAEEVEEELAAGLSEGRVAESSRTTRSMRQRWSTMRPSAAGAGFGIELVDEVDDVRERPFRVVADSRRGRCRRRYGSLPVPVPPINDTLVATSTGGAFLAQQRNLVLIGGPDRVS